jgi:hypothetical protein
VQTIQPSSANPQNLNDTNKLFFKLLNFGLAGFTEVDKQKNATEGDRT